MHSSTWEELFQQQLEAIVNHQPFCLPDCEPKALRDDLCLAQRLAALDLGAESLIRAALRSRLAAWASARGRTRHVARPTAIRQPRPQLKGAYIVAALLALLIIFNQPALAAMQRILGYGYLPEAGFIKLSETVLLKGPVVQQHNGKSIRVSQGIVNADRTLLWIGFDGFSEPPTEAWLDLGMGQRLGALSWSSDQDKPTRGKLAFAALPRSTQQTILSLPGGWRIPLEWAPSEQVGLAPTAVSVPYPQNTPTGLAAQVPCFIAQESVRICVQAAFVDAQGTHVLLSGETCRPGTDFGWDAGMSSHSPHLTDERDQVYPLSEPVLVAERPDAPRANLSLCFAPVAGDVQVVKLHLPALRVQLSDRSQDVTSSVPFTFVGPFELAFQLPKRQPMPYPTPKVIGRALPSPAPTAPTTASGP